MSDFATRIEAAGLRLSDQHQELSSLAASMSERETNVREAHSRTGDAVPGFNDALHTFADNVSDLESSSAREIEQSIQELGASAHGCADRIEAKWQVLNEAVADLRDRIGALPQVLETRQDSLRHHLEAHGAHLKAANAEAVDAASNLVASLEGLVHEQIETSKNSLSSQLERFADELERQLGPKLQRIAGDAAHTASDSLQAFGRVGSEASRALQQTIEHAISAVDDELQRALQESLPQLQRDLIDDASEALAKEIFDGIATSTIGTEVSAAMSPYMLELIAIKKVLEALLEAIRVFKNVTTVGGLFG